MMLTLTQCIVAELKPRDPMFPDVAHSILIHRVMMALQPTDLVEKLFAIDTQHRTPVTTQAMEGLDLDMLAPYIPMNFQLRSLTPEEPMSCGSITSIESSSAHSTQEVHSSYPSSPFSGQSCAASPARRRPSRWMLPIQQQ
ncbi:hypoxia-inducible factor 1-alpha-like isoform X1 [Genypterus blacodes]|uniref:hypoxia-inducible factor 1-alpha-like isoform X1 n=1 Tax=Genypterus blacodes TaxID=154954 RepID=UPI003F774FDD